MHHIPLTISDDRVAEKGIFPACAREDNVASATARRTSIGE